LVDTRSLPQLPPQSNEEEVHEVADALDPDHRKKFKEYHPDAQDKVRRRYLLKGPTKPFVNFPKMRNISRI
jgi:hypothetical protein